MWPFTSKTLYDRYSKLIKLIMSIDSHFEITENQEDSVRLHLPNYKGNQTMDFHIYLMEPFLCINYVTEIEGEKISTVNSYPQDMDQQDMFNAVMASNLNRIHQVIAAKNKEKESVDITIEKEETIPKEENKVFKIINVWPLMEFAKAYGKMQVGEFANKDTGEVFKSCIFTQPDGTRIFVAFSTKLGELTPMQIADMKNELQVVQLESGNYSLCKIDSGWKDVDLEEWLAAEANGQRASQNDSVINAVPIQSELVRKAKGILCNGEKIGIDTIFTSKDFIKSRKLKVKSLTAKFSIADIEESYMEGSQWGMKLGYYNISQDTQYHVSDIRSIEYDKEKDILKYCCPIKIGID